MLLLEFRLWLLNLRSPDLRVFLAFLALQLARGAQPPMANETNPASSSLSTPLLSPESLDCNSPHAFRSRHSHIAMDNAVQDVSLSDGHLSLPIKSGDGKDEEPERNPDEISFRMASIVEYTQDGAVDIHGRPSIKSKTGSWKACPFILGNECCERLAYYGINANMVVYLINVLHQGKATAAKNVNNRSGTCYITPIIGAFAADAFLGRYWTIASFRQCTLWCLDKAATKLCLDGVNSGASSPWHLCTVTQVEELKMLIRIMPIWATTIILYTIYSQMSTLFVEQGQTMDTSMGPHFKIPAAALSIFDTLSIIVWVPIYDCLLVPVVRYYTGDDRGFTQLQRMGIGLIVSVGSMVAAAIVEIKRLSIARSHGLLRDTDTSVPMSIFWQVPQYFLAGASEVFTSIGQLEFFYDQSPDATRSLCSALYLLTIALGSYLSSLLVTIVTRVTTRGGSPGWIPDNLNIGHLDYFFWLLAALGVVNFFLYLACAHWYKYKKVHSRSQ